MSLPVSDSIHTKPAGNVQYKTDQLTLFVTKVQSVGMTRYKYQQHVMFHKLLLTFDSLHADVVGRFPFVAVRLVQTRGLWKSRNSADFMYINPLNAELNPIYHLLALLGDHFLHVSRIRVK